MTSAKNIYETVESLMKGNCLWSCRKPRVSYYAKNPSSSDLKSVTCLTVDVNFSSTSVSLFYSLSLLITAFFASYTDERSLARQKASF